MHLSLVASYHPTRVSLLKWAARSAAIVQIPSRHVSPAWRRSGFQSVHQRCDRNVERPCERVDGVEAGGLVPLLHVSDGLTRDPRQVGELFDRQAAGSPTARHRLTKCHQVGPGRRWQGRERHPCSQRHSRSQSQSPRGDRIEQETAHSVGMPQSRSRRQGLTLSRPEPRHGHRASACTPARHSRANALATLAYPTEAVPHRRKLAGPRPASVTPPRRALPGSPRAPAQRRRRWPLSAPLSRVRRSLPSCD